MAQIEDFFMYENRVEGITDADYQRAQPYVEAAQAFAQTTYQSIYIIDYYHKNFLYVSDNPLFLCSHTADEVRQMGYGFYLSHVPENEVPLHRRPSTRRDLPPLLPRPAPPAHRPDGSRRHEPRVSDVK